MLFGSIPLAVQSTITKIHEIKAPRRVVITKAFDSSILPVGAWKKK